MARKQRDLSDWKTKAEVAELLGVSEKTVERYSQKSLLHQAMRPQTGKPPVVVYHPRDVDQLHQQKLEEESRPHVVIEEKPKQPTSKQLVRSSQFIPPEALIEKLVQQPEVRLTEKLFLSIKEASALSGLPQTFLRSQIKEGKLNAIMAGGYKIRRSDLEKL